MAQLLALNQPGQEAIQWLKESLSQAGLQLSQSFDFRSTRLADIACSCDRHIDHCDCNMAVLLVYGPEAQPATIVAHSHDGRTWLSLPDNPELRTSLELSSQIKSALAAAHMKNKTVINP